MQRVHSRPKPRLDAGAFLLPYSAGTGLQLYTAKEALYGNHP